MATRMIRVRHRGTGDTTFVSERAYPLFAAYYERLDQPDTTAPAPQPADSPAEPTPDVSAASRPASRSPRPAATTDKE